LKVTDSPNASNVLALLGGVSALEFAQPGVPLDLEENLVSLGANNLGESDQTKRQKPNMTTQAFRQRKKSAHCKEEKKERLRYLDVDRRVCILQLGLGVLGGLLVLFFRHSWELQGSCRVIRVGYR
jgi:hypothetical protein